MYIKKEIDKLTTILPKAKRWTKKIIHLFSFIIKIKKDFVLLFNCIEIVLSYNNKYYIPNVYSNDFTKNDFDTLLDELFDYFIDNSKIKDNESYTIVYENNQFKNTTVTTDKIFDYINKKYSNIKDIKDFIAKNTKIKKG